MWYNGIFNIYTNPKSKTSKKLAEYENNQIFINEFMHLVNDSLMRYDIVGLPENVSKRVVMQSLLWYGRVCFFEKNHELIALPCMPDGSGVNVYGDFSGAYVYGANGYNERIDVILPDANIDFLTKTFLNRKASGERKGIIVRENAMMYPFIHQTIYFARVISDTMRTLDVIRQNIKRPYIVTAEESVVNTVKEYFKKINNNEPVIISSGIFPADKIQVLPLSDNPESIHSASELIDWYEQKFREKCGFENMGSQIDKKGENLITAEVSSNDSYTRGQVLEMLEYLNQGFDLVNQLYGTNIKAIETGGNDENVQSDDNGEEGELQGERTDSTTDANI